MAINPDDAQARSELLIRDAEEALARERMLAFWHQWGATLIGMAVMLVVGTGAGVAWREWRQHKNEASTAQLLSIISDPAVPMTKDAAKKMNDNHAAIAWLVKAGALRDATTPEQIKELTNAYEQAAKEGDGGAWGQLARWNELRLKMDDEKTDAKKLMKEFDDLAGDMGGSALSALPFTDAAVIAGERLKDPAKALDYLARAEKHVPRSAPMAVTIADLRHLYEIRERTGKETAQ